MFAGAVPAAPWAFAAGAAGAGVVPAAPWAFAAGAAGDEGDMGPVATEVGDGWAAGVIGTGAVGV